MFGWYNWKIWFQINFFVASIKDQSKNWFAYVSKQRFCLIHSTKLLSMQQFIREPESNVSENSSVTREKFYLFRKLIGNTRH